MRGDPLQESDVLLYLLLMLLYFYIKMEGTENKILKN